MIYRRSLCAAAAALLGSRVAAADEGFTSFLAGVRADAIARGITAATVDRAFAGLRPNAKVLELDSRAPEVTQSWRQYRVTRVSEQRVAAGRAAMQTHGGRLAEIARRYGVQPAVLVSIWGLESNYGAFTGGFSVIEALATLAADGRHNGFFRAELISALRILDDGDISPARMTGSYAGAMGQPQFMPSSYLKYAIDFDGNGRRDIWSNPADVLASMANYLSSFGWRRGEPWCQPIRVPAGFDAGPNGREDRRPLGTWMRLGVTRADAAPFSRTDVFGGIVMPDGAGGDAYMSYDNFAVIRAYNPSDLYALSVGVLANMVSAERNEY